jgi:hypothetical protein
LGIAGSKLVVAELVLLVRVALDLLVVVDLALLAASWYQWIGHHC